MDGNLHRRVALNAGSAVIVVGITMFFFGSEAASDLTLSSRVVGWAIGICASLAALRHAFPKPDQ